MICPFGSLRSTKQNARLRRTKKNYKRGQPYERVKWYYFHAFGSSQTWLFQTWLFAIFTRKHSFALFPFSCCVLLFLRSFVSFSSLVFVLMRLRSFLSSCVQPRLERLYLGTSGACTTVYILSSLTVRPWWEFQPLKKKNCPSPPPPPARTSLPFPQPRSRKQKKIRNVRLETQALPKNA